MARTGAGKLFSQRAALTIQEWLRDGALNLAMSAYYARACSSLRSCDNLLTTFTCHAKQHVNIKSNMFSCLVVSDQFKMHLNVVD